MAGPAGAVRIPWRRDSILLTVVVALAVGLWAGTHYFAAAYADREQNLAREWYDRGDANMRAARFNQAIVDLRTALAYSHESPKVRLRLAEALADAKQVRQAEAYLKALWDEQPGNATVNLQLARMAVAQGDADDALRYYHGAIYGLWESDPIEARRQARLELIGFLLRRGERQQAQSELIAVAADLPRDPLVLTEVGDSFLQAGDPRRALQEFALASSLDPGNEPALRGAAQAAFQEQRYAEAKRYGEAALALDPNDTAAGNVQRLSALVLQLDPNGPRLTMAERAARAARALEQAQYRLEVCAAQKGITLSARLDQQTQSALAGDYAQLLSLKPRLGVSVLRREPDVLDTAMEVVYRSESDAEQQCGAGTDADSALLLLAKEPGGKR